MFACGRPLLLRIPNVKLFTTTAESTSQTNVVQQSLNSTTPPMGQDNSGANSGQSSSLRSKSSRYVHKNSALRTKRASQAEDNTMQSAGPKAYTIGFPIAGHPDKLLSFQHFLRSNAGELGLPPLAFIPRLFLPISKVYLKSKGCENSSDPFGQASYNVAKVERVLRSVEDPIRQILPSSNSPLRISFGHLRPSPLYDRELFDPHCVKNLVLYPSKGPAFDALFQIYEMIYAAFQKSGLLFLEPLSPEFIQGCMALSIVAPSTHQPSNSPYTASEFDLEKFYSLRGMDIFRKDDAPPIPSSQNLMEPVEMDLGEVELGGIVFGLQKALTALRYTPKDFIKF